MSDKSGGEAFPRIGFFGPVDVQGSDGQRWVNSQNGMTLRDYFASKAMNRFADRALVEGCSYEKIAYASYAIADAMLAERAK